jgi:hypothetical protein
MGLNFKRVSELGLEIIELEGQILLVDKLEHTKDRLILHQSINGKVNHFYKSDEIDLDDYNSRRFLGLTFNVIASTKPLEELPLLVIEDEVEKVFYQDNILDKEVAQHFFPLFKEGFNKAKETYKFTEEDMVEFAMNMISQYQFGNTNIHNRSVLMESLPKKELWVEVEEKHFRTVKNNEGQLIDHQFTIQLKITEGEIKAVWK